MDVVDKPLSYIASLDHLLSIAQTARSSHERASVLFESIQPAEVYDLFVAREAKLERLHIRVFYNSRYAVVEFAEMLTIGYNVAVGWMAIVLKRMVKAGFLLERHLVSSGETSSEGSGDEDQLLQRERKNFLITTADYAYRLQLWLEILRHFPRLRHIRLLVLHPFPLHRGWVLPDLRTQRNKHRASRSCRSASARDEWTHPRCYRHQYR
ncbi:hypothetical protein K440DRAFT_251986 [Wilcoxina mikolae CBS 423.85]|nr:hypothetical protein K440DRAFT_251986 [Wilcoxina mikolae CBS 423.85]